MALWVHTRWVDKPVLSRHYEYGTGTSTEAVLGGFKQCLGRFGALVVVPEVSVGPCMLGYRQNYHVVATLVIVRVVICRCLCTMLCRSRVAQSSQGAEQTSPEFLEHLHRST